MKNKIFRTAGVIVILFTVAAAAAYKYKADERVMEYAVKKLVQKNSIWLKNNIYNNETRKHFTTTKYLTNDLIHWTLEEIFGEKYFRNKNYTWSTRDEIIEYARKQLNNPDEFKKIVVLLRPVFLEEVVRSESAYEWQLLMKDVLIYFSEGEIDQHRYNSALDYLKTTDEYYKTKSGNYRKRLLRDELKEKEALFDERYPDGVGDIKAAVLAYEWLKRRGTMKAMWYSALSQIDQDLRKLSGGMSLQEVLETTVNYKETMLSIDQIVNKYRKSVKSTPKSVEAQCNLADAYIRKYQKNSKKKLLLLAKMAATKAWQVAPNSPLPHLSMARFFLAMDKYDKALNRTQKVIALDPENVEAKGLLKTIKRIKKLRGVGAM